MALTVFAEKMGFFHKGSGGFGVAPLDVCLSPPPGPVPIPYTNVLFAKDLIKGSKTVRIDGEPTFLEDVSETWTSIGDEGGTLGGSVVTGVILGKGFFMVWSMTVQIEGLGVCRHGDMMGQNSASAPPSSIDAAAVSQPASVTAAVPGPVAGRRNAQAEVLKAAGPGDSKPVQPIPCCFDKITIGCKHGRGPWEFTFDGQIKDNLPKPKGKKPKQPNLQGVAATKGDKQESFKIQISGGPGYGCSKRHPRINITNRSTGQKQTHEGKTELELPATCTLGPPPAHASMSPAAIIAYFWFPPGEITRYIAEIESCGVTANFELGFQKLSRQIDVFPNDKYKLSIDIPSVRKRNYEKAGTGPRRFPLIEHIPPAKKPKPGESRWNNETDYNKELDKSSPYHGYGPADRAIVEVLSTVKLERNNEDLKVSESLGKMVRAIAEIENNIQSVVNFIKDLQPTVGWKFSFSVGFFSGNMTLEWGWKEDPASNVVYGWWKFAPSLTLLSIELEAEFGVDVAVFRSYKVTLVLFGKISGEVKLETTVEATPDKPAWELTVGAEIAGELGLKAALGADWVTATGKIAIAFPFEAKPKIDPKDGFGIHWKLDYSGIKAHLVGSIKFVGSFSKTVQWTPPKTLGSGRIPKAAKLPTHVPGGGGGGGGH